MDLCQLIKKSPSKYMQRTFPSSVKKSQSVPMHSGECWISKKNPCSWPFFNIPLFTFLHDKNKKESKLFDNLNHGSRINFCIPVYLYAYSIPALTVITALMQTIRAGVGKISTVRILDLSQLCREIISACAACHFISQMTRVPCLWAASRLLLRRTS